jgi:predicted neuraminidase
MLRCSVCGRELHSPESCRFCGNSFCKRHSDPAAHSCPAATDVIGRRRAIKIGLGAAFALGLGSLGLRLAKVPIPGLPPAPLRRDRFIFDPQPVFPMSHASTIVGTSEGDLLVAWYCGSREKAPDVAIYCSRLSREGGRWTEPEVLADTPGYSEGNPVLWRDPEGRIWLFFVTMYGASWNDCKIKCKISEDHGSTWGEEVVLREELGWMTRNPPILLGGGEVLLPVYNEVNWHSMVIITSDGFRRWRAYGDLDSPGGAIQPSVIRRGDGSLLMYMRTDADRIYMSESRDEGRTWTPARPTALKNPNAAVTLLKLDSDCVALAYNDSASGRNPLNIALSRDDCESWRWKRVLEEGEGSYSYPALFQSADGRIHATFTYDRDTIKHVVLNETWIKGGL